MSKIALIVGLGNPGSQYAQTRHNAGFWYVERIAQRFSISLKHEPKFNGLTGRGLIEGIDVRLLLPATFMNKSGESVVPFAKFYQIQPSQLLIAHDELDLPAGQIRLKTGGGHGGHNGLRDIVPHLGADFHRLRIGIDHPGHRDKVSGHVLSKPAAIDQDKIDRALDEALQHTALIVKGEMSQAMNHINAFKVG